MKSSLARIGKVRMKDSGLTVYHPKFGAGTEAHGRLAKTTAEFLRRWVDIEAYYILVWRPGQWWSDMYFPDCDKYPRHSMPARIAEHVRENLITDPAIDAKLSDD